MAVCDFAYHRPESLAEACGLGRRLGGDAAYLAGGTELLPDFRRGRDVRRDLIALDAVTELRGVALQGDRLRIGAMTAIQAVADSAAVQDCWPALAQAARTLGSRQIRTQATIGGNFCRAVPCADTPPVCIVAGGTVHLAGPAGEREVPAEAFFLGPRRTLLDTGEVLVDIVLPRPRPRSGASYQRFGLRRGMSLAVASVAAWVALDGDRIATARLALGAVGPVPIMARRAMRVLEGATPNAESFQEAAQQASLEAFPISDVRGSAAYRRDLVQVLTRRALVEATAQARGTQP